MDFKNYLSQVFHELQLEFTHHYDTVNSQDYIPKNIHRLRVNIKKNKAFLDLLSGLNPDFLYAANVLHFDRLHKDMGKLRDIQITEILVVEVEKKLQLSSVASEKLIEAKLKRWDQFSKKNTNRFLMPFRLIPQMVQKRLDELAPESLPEQLRNYFIALLVRTDQQLMKKKIPYHEVRKNLKKIYYNLKLLNSFLEKKIDSTLFISLKKLLVLLGNWQDYIVQNKLFKRLKNLDPKLIEQLKEDQEKNLITLQNALKGAQSLENRVVSELFKSVASMEGQGLMVERKT